MPPMKLCRFKLASGPDVRAGLVTNDQNVFDLTSAGIQGISELLERADLMDELLRLSRAGLPHHPIDRVRLLTPVEAQEVWAAGVTYLRSKEARMEESDFSARADAHGCGARRPEIFFKSIADKVVWPGAAVGIRRDARWNVPEPELVLVINSS